MTQLRRALGLRTIVSTGAGMALATVTYISLIEAASYLTGNSCWIAILVAGFMAVMAGSCFCELNSMYPTAAGIKLYIEKAFNERAAIIIAGVYVLGQLSIIGAEIYILSQCLAQGFTTIPPLVWAAAFMAVLLFLNYRGIRIAGMTQDIIAYTMFIALVAVSIYGLARIDFRVPDPLTVGSMDGFIQAVAIGITCFIAFEWVVTISEEVLDVKMVPRGMMISLGVLTVVYALFGLAMTSVLDRETLRWVLDPGGLPIPHLLYGQKLLGTFGLYFMIIMAIMASLTSMNAGIMTSSRFIYAMARDWSLPRFLARLHPRYATPWAAMLVVTGYSTIVIAYAFLTHYILSMLFIIAAAECLMYGVMALCVLRLRKKEPDVERTFRIKGGPVVPVFVIVVYGIVAGFVLFGPVKPQDVIDQRICLFFLLALILLNTLYAYLVWPRLRAKYQKIAAARQPRRRRPPRDG
ncbi:MAG: APC family permease [Proteobacteria bacterium]|nr:APC family permease [Pseudomonadota bacterium]